MRIWAIFCLLIATLTMAAAPAMATRTLLPQVAMTDNCHGDGMVNDMAEKAAPSHEKMTKDMKGCLALCMVVQGAMVPRNGEFPAALREPVAQISAFLTPQLHGLAIGIDPPPPRA